MNSPPQPPQDATDIFSISDQVLADRLQFIEEIGFGNWGSVWLCRTKPDPSSTPEDTPHAPQHNTKIAVKLVHRSKTSTTVARVRSLWNEMKVVRSLKHEPHPSIIPFYSFIITPSYALITMAFHPRLVPVEVAEHHAKDWFHSLLSGVEFLHRRGVVHNDIKPANILLSKENVPVLVDFGFAERYELNSKDAFISNLSYGTPEYLSPERARGLPHDTRKSDVWSLGITFFEILIGRTPFEHTEGEQFSTKEDLEKYWSRTMRGKWVGSWKMSKSVEKMLRRMIAPNADVRCTASAAMADVYWSQDIEKPASHAHTKSASISQVLLPSTIDPPALNILPDWATRRASATDKNSIGDDDDKENLPSVKTRIPTGKTRIPVTMDKADKEKVVSPNKDKIRPASTLLRHARSQSASKLQTLESRGILQTRKHGLLSALSPIKHSPPTATSVAVSTSTSAATLKHKENILQTNSSGNVSKSSRNTRKPLGPRNPTPPGSPILRKETTDNLSNFKENAENILSFHPNLPEKEKHRRSRVFKDVTQTNRNVDKENSSKQQGKKSFDKSVETSREIKPDSVKNRMREWERERQRLREMERVEERMKEAEEEREKERERERQQDEELQRGIEQQRALEVELERQREWEVQLERTKARELERQRERERERDLELERERLEEKRVRDVEVYHGYPYPRIAVGRGSMTPTDTLPPTPLSPLIEEPSDSRFEDSYPPYGNESGLSILKQSLKMSIDKGKRLYKSSTLALGLSTPALSVAGEGVEEDESRRSLSNRASWEDEQIIREAKSSLPMIRHAVRNEHVAAENQLDRMTIWIRNVEKVVEDARQNFAASCGTAPLPPLPVAPTRSSNENRSHRSSRLPRKILPANQIFANDGSGLMDQTMSSSLSISTSERPSRSANASMDPIEQSVSRRRSFMDTSIPTIPSESVMVEAEVPVTPSKTRRRATIVTRSPEAARTKPSIEIDVTSPPKWKEKSRSQNDLGRPITPVTKLEFEIERLSRPTPIVPPRLSAIVDKNVFLASTSAPRSPIASETPIRSPSNDLTASPFHVEPYPPRPLSRASLAIDTPAKKHVEGVYDRFLMSTTGVKRVGRGYQSDNKGPVSSANITLQPKAATYKRNQHFFHSTRRPMPPPVSSDDLRRRSTSVDEFGVVACGQSLPLEEGGNTVGTVVRRAIKAMVAGKR